MKEFLVCTLSETCVFSGSVSLLSQYLGFMVTVLRPPEPKMGLDQYLSDTLGAVKEIRETFPLPPNFYPTNVCGGVRSFRILRFF